MKSEEKSAQNLALNLIKKWVRSNYIGYVQSNGTMFEKYDAKKVKYIFQLFEIINKIKNIDFNSFIMNFIWPYTFVDWDTRTCRRVHRTRRVWMDKWSDVIFIIKLWRHH